MTAFSFLLGDNVMCNFLILYNIILIFSFSPTTNLCKESSRKVDQPITFLFVLQEVSAGGAD
jgi:hypothetical protein